MNPVIPCSTSIVSFISGTAFSASRSDSLTKLNLSRKSIKHGSSTRRFLLPPFVSIELIPKSQRILSFNKKSRTTISATETDIAVEEPDSSTANDDSTETSEPPSGEVAISEDSSPKSNANSASAKARRSRSARKSEVPPVKTEDLVAGAIFTGKVKSISPFGAFVDLGAFTNGLIHVSNLSDSYVSDVASVVSVGQEVKVKVLKVEIESQRISLSMRERDLQQEGVAPISSEMAGPGRKKSSRPSSEMAGPGRKNTSRPSSEKVFLDKSTSFVKGQELQGTVKSLTKNGAFISLPQGRQGFLPRSEESKDTFYNATETSILQVGEEVSVRVLHASRDQITLTMKKEEGIAELDSQLSQGTLHVATNPFVLAFRKNKDIAAFLDEREKVKKTVENPSTEDIKETVLQQESVIDIPDMLDEPVKDNLKDDNSENKADVGSSLLDSASTAVVGDARDPVSNISSPISGVDVDTEKEATETSGDLAPEADSFKIVAEAAQTESLLEIADEKVNDKAKEDISESPVDVGASSLDGDSTAVVDNERVAVSNISSPISGVDGATEKEATETSGGLAPEADSFTANQIVEEAAQTDSLLEIADEKVTDKAKEDISESPVDVGASSLDGYSTAVVENERDAVSNISSPISSVDGASEMEATETTGGLAPEGDAFAANQIVEEATQTDSPLEIANENVNDKDEEDNSENQVDVGVSSLDGTQTDVTASHNITDSPLEIENENVVESGVEPSPEINGSIKGLESDIPSSSAPAPQEIADDKAGTVLENNCSDISSSGQTGILSSEGSLGTDGTDNNDRVLSPDSTGVLGNSVDEPKEVQEQAPVNKNENSFASQIESEEVGIASERNNSLSNANGQTGITSSEQGLSKATISPALVKQLREETGAGMMDCKKALLESGGDIIKAQECLRKKGLASAEKKGSRVTAEGRIGSYIHDSRIGVLVEVNCETDFVSRGEIFKELVDDISMQVAACPQVQYLVTEDVPESIVNKEKEIEMQKDDLLSKPEQIRSKIVEGRIKKRLEELALLEQPYIKNDKLAVKDLVKQTIATIGENIKVKRFVRFNLGEGLEKKSQDFAAEVAAQTAAKPVSASEKTLPLVSEAKETEQKSSTVAVSAALVKQLREETGAGMMDCKKALTETGGDLEKAQEYLRKKGLSSAEKKSSRLAAEGRIGSYIHDSRIGVLIEVNCETDFVGRSEKFKELVDDLAMQVVACPQVQFVSIEDIPESIVNKEKEIEMQREDILSKPENIRERIVEGRVSKRLGELALLEQPFIKDDNVLVKDFVKQTVAAIGENIKVRRFVRFTLGETS